MAAALAALAALGGGALRAMEPQSTELRWSELSARVTGRKIALALPEGAAVEGKAIAVTPDGLRLRISKTSDRKVAPKGELLVPRKSVSLVSVTEHGWIGRVLCSLGAGALTAALILNAGSNVYEGALVVVVPASAAAGGVGAAVGGYYIGKRIDRRTTEIRVIPD
jgi:hypothetical protein